MNVTEKKFWGPHEVWMVDSRVVGGIDYMPDGSVIEWDMVDGRRLERNTKPAEDHLD